MLGSAPVDEARMRKDAEEIEALRHASRVNDSVVAAAIQAVHEGAVESQLAALVELLLAGERCFAAPRLFSYFGTICPKGGGMDNNKRMCYT